MYHWGGCLGILAVVSAGEVGRGLQEVGRVAGSLIPYTSVCNTRKQIEHIGHGLLAYYLFCTLTYINIHGNILESEEGGYFWPYFGEWNHTKFKRNSADFESTREVEWEWAGERTHRRVRDDQVNGNWEFPASQHSGIPWCPFHGVRNVTQWIQLGRPELIKQGS